MKVIIFDEYCVLCNFWVKVLLRHDRAGRFHFAHSESDYALGLFNKPESSDVIFSEGVVLAADSQIFQGADAVIRIMEQLGGGWRVLSAIVILLPPGFRRWIYKNIASKRYRWFGKRNPSCEVGWRKYSDRFLP